MPTIRELFIKITGDSKGLDRAIGDVDKVMGKFGIKVGDVVNMLSGPAGMAAAAGIAAKAVWDVGVKFDNAYANISKATGATGKELEKLEFVFRNTMAGGIEQSIDEVSGAFGELRRRFGELGGQDLKQLTILFGDFADVTNQEMVPAIQDVSQLMRNWNLDTSQTANVLDRLYVASTLTGQSVQELASGLTAGGAVLRQAGYSFGDATALMSAFYAAGIDSSRMLAGLNVAIANFAKEGINAKDGIQGTFAAIKNAKTDVEATAKAVEVFGSRVGAQLADAIRSGKLSIDEINESLGKAGGKVSEVADASDTLKDKWDTFVNASSASGSRMGEYWIELAKIGLDILIPMMSQLARFGEVYFGRFVEGAKKIWTTVKPVFETLTQYLGAVVDFWAGVLTGNWKMAWNGLARGVLSAAKLIVQGVEGMVAGAIGGLNWLIAKINEGIKVLKLPLEPIKQITVESLGWSKAIDGLIVKMEGQRDVLIGLDKSTLKFKDSLDDIPPATKATATAVDKLTGSYENYIDVYQLYLDRGKEGLANLSLEEAEVAQYNRELATAQLFMKEKLIPTMDQVADGIQKITSNLSDQSTEFEFAIGVQADWLIGFARIASGDYIGGTIQMLDGLSRAINRNKIAMEETKKRSEEARKSTVEYQVAHANAEGELVSFGQTLTALSGKLEDFYGDSGMGKVLNKLKNGLSSGLESFKKLSAKYGTSIGEALGDSIINGMGKVDFMAAIGQILIKSMIAAALATGPIADQMAAIGKKISYMVINGFTEEGMAEVEAMASSLYDTFSTGVLPVLQRVQGIFGTGSSGGGGVGGEEIGSFASGVRNFRGGVAVVGEQGPERVFLPRGSSVESGGQRRIGGATFVFNSPKALSPMEMKRQMLQASRQIAFETGGNL